MPSTNGWTSLDHHDEHKKLAAADGTTVSANRYSDTDLTEIVHFDPTTTLWTVIWLRRGVVHGVGRDRRQAVACEAARADSQSRIDAARPALGLEG